MARDRIISGEASERDGERASFSLRPERLSECVGQKKVMEQLMIALQAARGRGEPMPHLLFSGPPGLGKTTFAHVLARESGATMRLTSGPAIAKQGDLMSLLTGLETGDVLFIDEIHRLSHTVEEFLYPAMEDFRVDFTLEGGIGGRTVNFSLNRFTLVGATTRSGLLTPAMRDRFGMILHFEFYQLDELVEILGRSANRLKVPYDTGAIETIAGRSRGTPRVANRLLQRVRDYSEVRADGKLTERVVCEALELLQVDALGLDDLDRGYLRTLITTYEGGPAGIEALAATMGQERDTLEDVVEPYLLQIGFVIRTRQGRRVTRAGYDHLGMALPATMDDPGDAEGSLF
jgi:Holliday junction DNA helicase RuvB